MNSIKSFQEQRKEALVKQQGEAYQASYNQLMEEDPHAVVEVDDFIITAAFEKAEGMYILQTDLSLKWVVPEENDNQHIEVIVQDRKDKRFVPYLTVSVTLYKDKQVVFEHQVPFIWHPFVYHYGINGKIPEKGDYTPVVHIRMPLFHRHDEVRGKMYTKDITVKLSPVTLLPGQKPHGPE